MPFADQCSRDISRDPRGIRHALGQSFCIFYHTHLLHPPTHPSIHPSIHPPKHTHTHTHAYIHTNTKRTHVHRSAKRFCGFSFVSNNSIVVNAVGYLSEIYNFHVLFFAEYDQSTINRGDRADDLFSRPRKRPFVRLPRLSIFTLLSRIS